MPTFLKSVLLSVRECLLSFCAESFVFQCAIKNLKVKVYRTIILPIVLYGCETWLLTLREERRLRVLENRVCFLWRCGPTRAMASTFLRFLDHTQRRTTVGRTPLDEWSARRRDLYLTTHNTHNRQTSMPPVGFKPMIRAGERPQTYALDRAATGTGLRIGCWGEYLSLGGTR